MSIDNPECGVEVVTNSIIVVGNDAPFSMSLADLPPRVPPNTTIRQRQATGGSLLVITLLVVFVSISVGILFFLWNNHRDDHATWILVTAMILVVVQTLAALLCLTGILYANPGVVPRTPATCFPIPEEMIPWLRQQQQQQQQRPSSSDSPCPVVNRPSEPYLTSSSSQDNNSSRDTYCTRCLVWRRQPPFSATTTTTTTMMNQQSLPSISYFHCQVCQWCVSHYDHHCDIFGRCIAGTILQGNLAYFYGLLAVGSTTYVTCWALILAAVVQAWKHSPPPWIVVLTGMAGILVVHYVCIPCVRGPLANVQKLCVQAVSILCFRKSTRTT